MEIQEPSHWTHHLVSAPHTHTLSGWFLILRTHPPHPWAILTSEPGVSTAREAGGAD